eukprot:302361_1
MIHSCNIYGKLPSNVQFSNLHAMSMFENRLSCTLPNDLVYVDENDTNFTAMIIPSNLFECDAYETPLWMQWSLFLETYKLHLSNYRIIKSYIFGLIGIILATILSIQFIRNLIMFIIKMRSIKRFQKQLSVSLIDTHENDETEIESVA